MDILGITIWREARSEGLAGMNAVAHVIANRGAASPHNAWPSDVEQVCLQPWQFSCWNLTDPQRNLYPKDGDPQYAIAQRCPMMGDDPTSGATAYFDVSILPPPWAHPEDFTAQIGRLKFYKL